MKLVEVRGGLLAVDVFEPAEVVAEAVLVHGYTGSKEDFSLLGPLLADRGIRVVTFDQRGYFESGHSDSPEAYQIPEHARDVLAIAKEFSLQRPHLLGHSFGGLVAQHAVVQAPSAWASLTLFCSGPAGFGARPDLQHNIDYLADHTMAEEWQNRSASGLPADRAAFLQRRWLTTDSRAIRDHAHQLMWIESVVAQVANTGTPAHVVYGEFDDAWPIPDQLQMAADLSAQVTVMPGTGHCPNEDDPVATAKVLSDWWLSLG